MLCFWRWKQVYASTSTVDCDQVCNALSEAGVRYIRKGKTGHPVFFLGGDTGKRKGFGRQPFSKSFLLCIAG